MFLQILGWDEFGQNDENTIVLTMLEWLIKNILLYKSQMKVNVGRYQILFSVCLVLILMAPCYKSACTNVSLPYAYAGSCYALCPWTPSVQTYAYTPNNTCLTCNINSIIVACPASTYFADDASRACVNICPSSPIVTYYDTNVQKCVKNCSTNPSQYAYLPTLTCLQYCISTTFADDDTRTCVTTCPIGTYYQVLGSLRICTARCYPNYYADLTKTCVSATSCPTSPQNYYGDDSTNLCVQTCPSSANTYADNSSKKCLFYCPLGTYANPTTQKCDSICPTIPAYFGSNITRNCLLLCNQGQFADSTNRQCTQYCSSGLFGDYFTRNCVTKCPTSQNTYADPLTRLCIAVCSPSYFSNNDTQSCVAAISCSGETVGNPITSQCVKAKDCPLGFFVDLTTKLCVQRCVYPAWGNLMTKYCVDFCDWNPPNYITFQDPSTQSCVTTCPNDPRSFGDNNTRSCVSTCPSGYFGTTTTFRCVLTCPDGFYSNSLSKLCVSNCSSNSSNILYFYKVNTTCLSTCPINYFADNSTLTCVTVCPNNTFSYAIDNTCQSLCPLGYFGDYLYQACLTSCSQETGYFADPSTNLCVKICPSNPDYYGQDLNNGNKTCVAVCSLLGYFADPVNRICTLNCNLTAGYFGYLTDNRCYLRCPTGYGNNITKQCVNTCPNTVKDSFGDNITARCVYSCPDGSYGDPNNHICMQAVDCTPGLFGDDLTHQCVSSCAVLYNLFGDPVTKKCVYTCQYPYYADNSTRQCSLTCNSTNQYFKDASTKRCVKNCPSIPDLYNDPNTMACQLNCTNNWYAYTYGTIRTCVSMCPSSPAYLADQQNRKCVLSCANLTYKFINNTYRGCLDYCPPQVFTSTFSINLFADNTTWTCVSVCPSGYYAFLHPTNSTIRLCVRYCRMVAGVYYYADDVSRSCVTSCPMFTYGTYGDQINFKCVSTCSDMQYRDNTTGLCVYRCPPLLFADNTTYNCLAVCANGYYAQSINNTCAKHCPTNYYAYNKTCITQCPPATFFYNDNSTWFCVETCPFNPDYYADFALQACVLNCTSNTFADSTKRQCLPAINCSLPTIADPVSHRCVLSCTIVPMYYLTISTNLCGASCSDGLFAFNLTNTCQEECPAPYFGVNTTGSANNFYCAQYCPPGEYMFDDIIRFCLQQCPNGYFNDNLTMSCVSICPDYYYANTSNAICTLTCFPLYADDSTKTCVSVCPVGKTASNNSYKCQDYCDYGQYSNNKTCIPACPIHLYADNLTRSCVTSCPHDPLTYLDSITKTCVFTCSATEYAFLANQTCLSICPLGYYKELTLRLCTNPCLYGYFTDNSTATCVSSCLSLNFPFADPTTQACVQICPANPDLYGHSNQCITQCPPGWFAENYTRTCVQICPNVTLTQTNHSFADVLTRRCLQKCSALSYSYSNSTNNVCLNNCPVNFYASISLQACVAQCPNGTFAENATNTCVVRCPNGEWADILQRICMPNCLYNSSLYADNSTNQCVETCPIYPDLYADGTTGMCVLTCPPPYYSYNITRSCELSCPSPFLADDTTSLCVISCPSNTLQYADYNIRKCVSSCTNYTLNGVNSIEYIDNSTVSCVKQCPLTPQTLYGFNTTNKCLSSCPPSTFGDNDTRVCLDICVFQNPKFTWMDSTSNFCVKYCPYGYFADNATRSCALTCSGNTFADNSTRRCVNVCPQNPVSYGITVSGTKVCVYNCPNGTFSDELTVACVLRCPTTPFYYYHYTPTNRCVKECTFPYFAQFESQFCITNCKVGFYGNLTTKRCQICQIQCVTCSGYLQCTSCLSGFFLYQHTCVVSCPSYPVMYFANLQSAICFKACPSPYFGEVTTKQCQLACPVTYYANTYTRICTICATGCITCNNLGCFTCFSGYIYQNSTLTCNKFCNLTSIYFYGTSCYQSCPNGTYLTTDLVTCAACSAQCATCFGVAGNCSTCAAKFYYQGNCVDACPSNYFIGANLMCTACALVPSQCILPPLNYTIYPFTANYQLQAYVIFNRAVNMTVSQFIQSVQIKYNGQALTSSQYVAKMYNTTTYWCTFTGISSLNQNSLSFYFPPGAITDSQGNYLTTATVTQNVTTTNTGVTPDIAASASTINNSTQIVSYVLLALILLFFIKSGYPVLITVEVAQIIYMHTFIFVSPLPFLLYKFLDALKYLHLMFLPQLFTSLNYVEPYYKNFISDVSFLSNCSPFILLFGFVLFVYLLFSILSSKFVTNKAVRKFAKKVRKYRLRYNIIHDAFWFTFLYAFFFAVIQFKYGQFGSTSEIINMTFAILVFLLYIVFTVIIVYLGFKYRKVEPENLPKKYAFLCLEPSQFPLEMPVRYIRKLLICLALLFPDASAQIIVMMMVNMSLLIYFICFRPSKSQITNTLNILIEAGYIIMEGLFFGYLKLINKTTDAQQGFAIALVAIQSLLLLVVLVWIIYRLILVIKQSDTWKLIYAKVTENTDPEYLKELQKKRDLEFDFGSLENRSIEDKTEIALEKTTNRKISLDQKYNIFDQNDEAQVDLLHEKNQKKPLRKEKRVSSAQISDATFKSSHSDQKPLFEPNKSNQNYRKNKNRHLEIREKSNSNDLEEIIIRDEESQIHDTNSKKVQILIEEPQKDKKVLWENIQFDENQI